MRIGALMIASLLAVTPAAGQADSSELERLESVWNSAHRAGDVDALDRIWADDLEVNVPGMTPMNKAESLAFARAGRMRFERYETSDVKVRVYGDTAVVTGRLQRTRTVGGRQRADDWRFTKVYARQAGAWRVVSFHASDSPPR